MEFGISEQGFRVLPDRDNKRSFQRRVFLRHRGAWGHLHPKLMSCPQIFALRTRDASPNVPVGPLI